VGANYDVILVRGKTQQQVVDCATAWIQTRGRLITRILPTEDHYALRPRAIDDVCFVGPSQGDGWVPVAGNCATLGVSLAEWFNDNPLAAELSRGEHPAIQFWSYDSGYAAGYSLFSDGRPEESLTVFCRSHSGKDLILPGVPAPSRAGSLTLGEAIKDPTFDFRSFVSSLPSLEKGTAAMMARLGLREHLFDIDHLARGMGAGAIVKGRYKTVALSGWLAIVYEQPKHKARTRKQKRR